MNGVDTSLFVEVSMSSLCTQPTLSQALSDFLALKPPLAPLDDAADDGCPNPFLATPGPPSGSQQPAGANAEQMDTDAVEPGREWLHAMQFFCAFEMFWGQSLIWRESN